MKVFMSISFLLLLLFTSPSPSLSLPSPSSSSSPSPLLALRQSSSSIEKKDERSRKPSSSIVAASKSTLKRSVSISKTSTTSNVSSTIRIQSFLSLFLPFLYFTAVAINFNNQSRWVSFCVNENHSIKPTAKSAKIHGFLSGIDSFFTFLTVNLYGNLSDSKKSRKPFMIFSAVGLGISLLISSMADRTTSPLLFYLSSTIDGLSSCMFSQAQAFIVDFARSRSNSSSSNNRNSDEDVEDEKSSLSIALSRFQGISIGFSFIVGVPISGFLGEKYSPKVPIYLAICLCFLCAVSIALFLPETSIYQDKGKKYYDEETKDSRQNRQNHENQPQRKLSKFNWNVSAPWGALIILSSSKTLVFGSISYLLITFAHAGMQINLINYLNITRNWSLRKGGNTWMSLGVVVAFLPQLLLKFFHSPVKAIKYGLLIHSISIIGFASLSTNSDLSIYVLMFFFAIGSSSMPNLLGFLSNQVSYEDVGSLQGAADTLRTLSNMISFPLSSYLFSKCINQPNQSINAALLFSSLFSFLAFLLFHFFTLQPHQQRNKVEATSSSSLQKSSSLSSSSIRI